MFRELWQARNLLLNLIRRDLTIRYKSSVLGFFWSFIKPLALTGVFWLVFDKIMGLRLQAEQVPFTLHLLVGILAWTLFAGATSESLTSVISNANLIKKVKLPLMVFPIAVVCSHLVHFVLAFFVLFALSILMGLPPSPAYLLVPFVMALMFIFTVAVSLILSAVNVFYRDVTSIWEVIVTAWFYATPIIYPVYMALDEIENMGKGWLYWIYMANPMTPMIIALRRLLLYASLDTPGLKLEMSDGSLFASLLASIFITFLVFYLGIRIFSHFSQKFADEL